MTKAALPGEQQRQFGLCGDPDDLPLHAKGSEMAGKGSMTFVVNRPGKAGRSPAGPSGATPAPE